MRIRKRAVPLPLSLLSPVPLDPLHHHHPLVQLQLPSSSSDDHHQQPHADLISHHRLPTAPLLPYEEDHDKEKNKDQREQISNNQSDSGAVAVADNGVIPSPSKVVMSTGDDRWCDGDKAIPLKKRKASFEMNGVVVAKESRMKSKTNKKCPLSSTALLDQEEEIIDDQDDDYVIADDSDSVSTDYDGNNKKTKTKTKKRMGKQTSDVANDGAKKKPSKGKKKGGSIMEGSRCSRVNGRGWRCMQPTLVGYSLCEHHLGKGRLRSMASVRARAKPSSINSTSSTTQASSPPSVVLLSEIPVEKLADQEDNSRPRGAVGGNNNKKRTRIGMVKARSLSSLLCQPNTSVVQLGSSTTTSQIKLA